ESARLLVGASNSKDANGNNESDLMDAYVQYLNTNLAEVGNQKINLLLRGYIPTSDASQDAHLIIPQARAYLFTDFAITEKFTVSPYYIARGYVGDNKYQGKDTNKYARSYYMVELAYAFN